ncbi:MAG: hypothetical protein QE269_07115 [Fimbriimonas sp.]|jgi:hypothetical protein|nr:hypothetical protein [Fimbriimonas sp.]
MASQDAVQLSPEEIQAIKEGLRSESEEPTCTMEEAFDFARTNRKEWLKTQSA